jgi:hypothetical protein
MAHEFVILRNGILEHYANFEDIPQQFENVIKFLPDIPDAPHTEDQHNEIHEWHGKLKELLKREAKG